MISTLTRYMISKSTRYKPLFEAVVGRHASGRDGMILMWQSSSVGPRPETDGLAAHCPHPATGCPKTKKSM